MTRRKWTSNLSISALRVHRGRAPKQAIGVTMASKKIEFGSAGHISAQQKRFVGKEGAICRLQRITGLSFCCDSEVK